MNPYIEFVQGVQTGVASAKGLNLSEYRTAEQGIPNNEGASKVLLFSPHPDDECITGLLPLRLQREAGMQIINVPVTFGSDIHRQAGRANELADACAYLGWSNCVAAKRFAAQGQDRFLNLGVDDVVAMLKEAEPQVLFVPHSKDWNSRHISTHFLVAEALEQMPPDFSCTVVETEFWGAMDDPNLMIEGDVELVADLVAATSLHVEEVARNPYHLSLPAWMQDNVRRGAELVGGQGGAVPDFSFATLYRLRTWKNRAFFPCLEHGTAVPVGAEYLMEII